MSTTYWSQWDRDDLDSWQGKDLAGNDFHELDIDFYGDDMTEDEDSCSCSYQCMDCLGFSFKDFI
jgi:hypothetical protein